MPVWYRKRRQGLPLIFHCMALPIPFSSVCLVTGLRSGPPACVPCISALFNVSSNPCQGAWCSALAGSPCQGFCSWKHSPNQSCLDFKCTVFSALAQYWCLLLTQNLGGFLVSSWASAKWKVSAQGNPLLDLYPWKQYGQSLLCQALWLLSWGRDFCKTRCIYCVLCSSTVWSIHFHTFRRAEKPKCKALSLLYVHRLGCAMFFCSFPIPSSQKLWGCHLVWHLIFFFSGNFSYTKKDFKAVSTCFQYVTRLVTTFCSCGGQEEIRSLILSALYV